MVQMNRFAGQQVRHRCREQTYGHQGAKVAGAGGGGVLNWEIGIDMYTLLCVKWMTNKKKNDILEKKKPETTKNFFKDSIYNSTKRYVDIS